MYSSRPELCSGPRRESLQDPQMDLKRRLCGKGKGMEKGREEKKAGRKMEEDKGKRMRDYTPPNKFVVMTFAVCF